LARALYPVATRRGRPGSLLYGGDHDGARVDVQDHLDHRVRRQDQDRERQGRLDQRLAPLHLSSRPDGPPRLAAGGPGPGHGDTGGRPVRVGARASTHRYPPPPPTAPVTRLRIELNNWLI